MTEAYAISRPFANSLTLVARSISDLFSPAIMAIPCLLLGVLASDVPGTYRFALLYFLIVVPLPTAYVVWLVKSGRVSDIHLPNRSDRLVPFLITIAAGVLAVGLLFALGAPTVFLAPVLTALLQTLVLCLITLAWQISIHTATTAGLVTFALLALGAGAAILLPLVPMVMWARLYLGRHTLAQATAGVALGCLAFSTLFALQGIAW